MILEDHTAGTNSWLSVPRPTITREGVAVSGWPPRIIEIHCTRGGARDYDTEYRGAINWSRSPTNRHVTAWGEVWGSAFTYVVNGSKVARILPDDVMPTYSAGYGGAGTWPVDFCAVSIEVCQMRRDSPIPIETRQTVAELAAEKCREWAIPVRRLAIPDQTVWPPPSGFVGHEDTANGRILGKDDPGPRWVWNEFLWEVRHKLVQQEEDDMEEAAIRQLVQDTMVAHENQVHPDERATVAQLRSILETVQGQMNQLVESHQGAHGEASGGRSLQDIVDGVELTTTRLKVR